MDSLVLSITTYDYFVNWEKVDQQWNLVKHETALLDAVLRSEDPAAELDELLMKYPEVARALPALLAIRLDRKREINILTDYEGGNLKHETFLFDGKPLSAKDRSKLIRFARDSGILDLFSRRVMKSIPDYTRGVEVGIDTNGRKNRGGQLMERVVEEALTTACEKHGWRLITQPTSARLQNEWGIEVKDAKTAVRPDFAISAPSGLWLVETNFFNKQGSKLKATAGEYRGKFEACRQQGHHYLWITDGTGWLTSRAALRECFDTIDFMLNLEMCGRGCLEDIVLNPEARP